MSEILDKIKQAEEQRARLVAERKRLEAEADAALAAQDRDAQLRQPLNDLPGAAAAPAAARVPRHPHRNFPWGWAAGGVALLAAATVVVQEQGRKESAPPAAPGVDSIVNAKAEAQAPPAAIVQPSLLPPAGPETAAAFSLKIDRDLDAFAARVRALEKPP